MTILLVEDENRAREGLKALLEEDGFEVTAVATFAEACAALNEASFEVALLDVRLPDGNGKDLVPKVKQASPGARVFLATGSSQLEWSGDRPAFEDPQRAAEAVGADGCISKPINYAQLLEMLS